MHAITLFVGAMLSILPSGCPLSAQDPTPAPAAARRDAPTSDRAKRVAEAVAKLDQLRQGLLDQMNRRIEACTDESELASLEQQRNRFDAYGIVPPSLGLAARNYQLKRTGFLAAIQHQLESATSLATEPVEQLELARREHAESLWIDLRPVMWGNAADWTWQDGSLVSPEQPNGAALCARLSAPEQGYELRLELERLAGNGPLWLAFPRANGSSKYACVAIGGAESGLLQPDLPTPIRAESLSMQPEQIVKVVVQCSPSAIRVWADGVSIVDHGDLRSLQDMNGDKRAHGQPGVRLRACAAGRFHLHAIEYRDLAPPAGRPAVVSVREPATGRDFLPQGKRWQGRLEDGLAVTAVVAQRDRDGRTAVIRLRGANGWDVTLRCRTNANGTRLSLDDTKRKDAKVRIFDEEGNGSASEVQLSIRFRWANERNGCGGRKRGVFESSFTGTPAN